MSLEHARRLRSNPTEAEKHLWARLRQKQTEGCRFRRQVPLGPYIADFVCLELRLVIEVDGGQHAWDVARDGQRTTWLECNGFHVLRFWNNEILANIDGVLHAVRERILELRHSPHPTSPARGEEV